jgi:hypothetical protein
MNYRISMAAAHKLFYIKLVCSEYTGFRFKRIGFVWTLLPNLKVSKALDSNYSQT